MTSKKANLVFTKIITFGHGGHAVIQVKVRWHVKKCYFEIIANKADFSCNKADGYKKAL